MILFRRPLSSIATALGTLMLLVVLTACSVNPITGKKEFQFYNRQEQVQMGLSYSEEFKNQGGGQIDNATIQNYVAKIGTKVLAAVPEDHKSGFDFTFTVLNDEVVNAFALPGGPVFITRGILNQMDNEAQLAFILGHEIGHVVAEHSARQMSLSTIMTGVMALGTLAASQTDSEWAALGMELSSVAGSLYLLKFGRDEESQSDMAGLQYMVAAGYDPNGAVMAMEMLDSGKGQSSFLDEWMSTHPDPGNRTKTLKKLIEQNYTKAVNNPSYVMNESPYVRNVKNQLAADAKKAAATQK